MSVINPSDLLILGHMPLVGVSYQSREKDEEYLRLFAETSETRNILLSAIRCGIGTFAAGTLRSSPLSSSHLKVISQLVDEGLDIDLIPCVSIPLVIGSSTVNSFRRWATYLDVEKRVSIEVRRRAIEDPILNFREGWRNMLPGSKPYSKTALKRLKIDWKQIDEDLEPFVDFPVKYMEPGSEVDFIAIAKRFDLIGELLDRIKARGFRKILLGVHHAGVTIPKLDDELQDFDGYVTPLNALGVMMFPTKSLAERAVRNTKKSVYAIKPLAGGRLEPRRAFNYVFSFDLSGCMIGVGSIAEMKEDFNAAINVLVG